MACAPITLAAPLPSLCIWQTFTASAAPQVAQPRAGLAAPAYRPDRWPRIRRHTAFVDQHMVLKVRGHRRAADDDFGREVLSITSADGGARFMDRSAAVITSFSSQRFGAC